MGFGSKNRGDNKKMGGIAVKKIKVLLGTSSFGASDTSPLHKLSAAGFEVLENPYKRKLTKKELFGLLPGVEGLIAGLEPLDRDVLKRSDLKVISRCGSGLSNIDLESAKELGIVVRSTPLAPVEAVAELTIGCLLALLRQVIRVDCDLRHKNWTKVTGRQLSDMTVAIIGFGNIGKRIGQLLKVFGSKVIAVDPLLSGVVNDVPIVTLDTALKTADIISLHCGGEKCLIGEKEFGMMRKGAYLLNAARGNLIDEMALIQAIENGIIKGGWFDVFEQEPYEGKLIQYPQVILTPHVGSYTLECRKNMETEAAQNLIDAFKNRGA